MENEEGYYTTELQIKEDATPVDNITKFAYDDDDYIEVSIFHKYTPEELLEFAKQEIEELKSKLAESDYISSKIIDYIITCSGVVEFFDILSDFKTEYGSKIEERKTLRKQIKELEEKLHQQYPQEYPQAKPWEEIL